MHPYIIEVFSSEESGITLLLHEDRECVDFLCSLKVGAAAVSLYAVVNCQVIMQILPCENT